MYISRLWVKQITIHNVGGPHPISWRLLWEKTAAPPGKEASAPRWPSDSVQQNQLSFAPLLPACSADLPAVCNYMHQFLKINLPLYILVCSVSHWATLRCVMQCPKPGLLIPPASASQTLLLLSTNSEQHNWVFRPKPLDALLAPPLPYILFIRNPLPSLPLDQIHGLTTSLNLHSSLLALFTSSSLNTS